MKYGRIWLLVPAAVVSLLLAAALALLIAESMSTTEAGEPVLSWSTTTWFDTLTQPYFWTVLRRTVLLGLVVTGIGLVLGYPTALALVHLRAGRMRLALFALIFSPLLISAVVRVYAWYLVLGPSGILRSVLAPFSGDASNPFASFAGVTVVLAQSVMPLAVFPIFAALTRIDKELSEAAYLLGASPIQGFLRVTLPLSAPTAIAAAQVIFIIVISSFAVPTLVGQGRVQVVAGDAFQEVSAFNWALGSVEVLALLIVSLIAVIVGSSVSGRLSAGLASTSSTR